MRLGPRLELKQSQRLVMTPQLQQALKVLQMPALDVAAFIAEEVAKNPLLSLDDGGRGEASAPQTQGGVDRQMSDATPGAAQDGFDTGRENLSGGGDRLGVSGEPAAMPSGGGQQPADLSRADCR